MRFIDNKSRNSKHHLSADDGAAIRAKREQIETPDFVIAINHPGLTFAFGARRGKRGHAELRGWTRI